MAHFSRVPFNVKSRFFYYSQVGKWRQIGYAINPSYFSDIGLGALVLVAHNGVVGGGLEGAQVVEVHQSPKSLPFFRRLL